MKGRPGKERPLKTSTVGLPVENQFCAPCSLRSFVVKQILAWLWALKGTAVSNVLFLMTSVVIGE